MNRRQLLSRFAAIAAAVAVAPVAVAPVVTAEARPERIPCPRGICIQVYGAPCHHKVEAAPVAILEQQLCGGSPSIGQRQIAREYRALCTNGVSGIQALDEYEQAIERMVMEDVVTTMLETGVAPGIAALDEYEQAEALYRAYLATPEGRRDLDEAVEQYRAAFPNGYAWAETAGLHG